MIDVIKTLRRVERADARNSLACAHAQALCSGIQVESRQLAGGYAIFAGYWTHLTQTIGTGVSGPVTARDVAKVARFFTDRRALPIVHVADAMPLVLQRFRAEGFHELGDCHILVKRISQRMDAGLTADVKALGRRSRRSREWIRASSEGFLSQVATADDELIIGRTLFKAPASHFYVTAPDGGIAGTASLAVWSRVAMMFGDSTRAACRGMGVQSRLIKARLAHAREVGCDVAAAVVQPGSGSERNYLRHGFHKLYSRITLCREA